MSLKSFLKVATLALAAIAVSLLALMASCSSNQELTNKMPSPETLPIAPSYTDGKFENWVVSPVITGGWFKIMKDWINNDAKTTPDGEVPVIRLTADSFEDNPSEGLVFWWLGHSTLIVEIGGNRFLIDPVLSKYASPVPGFVKRFSDSPISVEDLPPIDFVVLSHNHYDHMDKSVLKSLAKRDIQFFVPTGVGSYMIRWGIDARQITERYWWDMSRFKNLEIVFVPSRHFSNRGLFDRNESLWGGWIIKSQSKSVYYSGDGGYGDHFKLIGEIHGPFDLAIIENGAYNEKWPHVHSNGTEATQAAIDVGGQLFFPVHWGAFNLAPHDWNEPIIWALREATARKVPIVTPQIGQRVDVEEPVKNTSWWESVDTPPGLKE